MRNVLFIFLLLTALLSADSIQWEQCPELMPGVRLARFEETQPRLMKVNILRVDLTIPGLRFAGTPRSRGWGNQMPDYPQGIIRTFRQTTKDFMLWNRTPWNQGGRGRNMIIAINSVPWDPWCKPFTHTYAEPLGLMISGGVLVADNQQITHAEFIVYRDGRPDIVSNIPKEDYPKIWLAACGFAIIMKNGEITCADNGDMHPRTVYGLSQDRRWLYLMTIDGRQNDWSLGARDIDSANLMKRAGAWDAINMDGGGSTTMCY